MTRTQPLLTGAPLHALLEGSAEQLASLDTMSGMQAQSRHRLRSFEASKPTVAKSLRDNRMRFNVAGRMGVLHAAHGVKKEAIGAMNEMFEQVVGLGDEPDDDGVKHATKAAKETAERIYRARLSGDEEALQEALAPLIEQAEKAAAAAAAAESEGAPASKDAAAADEFEPAVGVDAPQPPAWRVLDVRGVEPLALACVRGHAGAVRLLLRAKADANAAARTCGRTAAHRACEAGRVDTLQELVEHGADPTLQCNNGATPLLLGASRGHLEAVEFLLGLRVDPTAGAEDGGAPVAADEELDTRPRRCPVDQADHSAVTPLMAAAANGYTSVCEVLLDAGANVHALDRNHWSALHHACRGGHRDVALLLVNRGAAITPTKGGRSLRQLDAHIADEAAKLAASLGASANHADRPFTAPM